MDYVCGRYMSWDVVLTYYWYGLVWAAYDPCRGALQLCLSGLVDESVIMVEAPVEGTVCLLVLVGEVLPEGPGVKEIIVPEPSIRDCRELKPVPDVVPVFGDGHPHEGLAEVWVAVDAVVWDLGGAVVGVVGACVGEDHFGDD